MNLHNEMWDLEIAMINSCDKVSYLQEIYPIFISYT